MRRLWLLWLPWALFFLGVAFNVLVITANHGSMPVVVPVTMGAVDPGAIMDQVHVVWSSSVHLALLADWIQIPWLGVASPGDLLLWLGDWLRLPLASAYIALVITER